MLWTNILSVSTVNASTSAVSSVTANSVGYSTLSGSTINASKLNYSSIAGSSISSNTLTLSLTNASTQNTQIYQVATTNPTTSYTVIQASHVSTGTTNNALALNPSGGNVGVGTTTPAFPVTLSTSSALVGSPGFTHTNGTITVGSYVGGSLAAGWYGTASNHPLCFYTNDSAPQVTLSTNGNVGIGTTNPTQGALQVNGRSMFGWSSGVRRGMLIDNESAYGVTPCIQGVDSALGTNAISINPAGGNVGIGTNNPTYPFDVNGNARFKGTVGYSPAGASANTMYYWWTTTQFGFSVDNSLFYYVSPSSDYRIKENIQSPSPILSRLCAINMIEYEFKTQGVMKNDGKRLGVFAHELQEAFPEYPNIVMGKKDEVNEDGSIKIQSVAGEAIGYLVMKSVQELASQATSQDMLVQELSTQLAATQQQLAAKSAALDALIAWAQTQGYSASV